MIAGTICFAGFKFDHLCSSKSNNRQQDSATSSEDASNLLNKALLPLVPGQVLGHSIGRLHNDCNVDKQVTAVRAKTQGKLPAGITKLARLLSKTHGVKQPSNQYPCE